MGYGHLSFGVRCERIKSSNVRYGSNAIVFEIPVHFGVPWTFLWISINENCFNPKYGVGTITFRMRYHHTTYLYKWDFQKISSHPTKVPFWGFSRSWNILIEFVVDRICSNFWTSVKLHTVAIHRARVVHRTWYTLNMLHLHVLYFLPHKVFTRWWERISVGSAAVFP